MIKNILITGTEEEKWLRKVCLPVDPDEILTDEFQSKVDDLVETSLEAGGLGLAAPQIGWDARVFVINTEPELVVVNPVVVGHTGKVTSRNEGCLSVPDDRFNVKRYRNVTFTFINGRTGEEDRLSTKVKREAIVLQHEFDHLNGLLVDAVGRSVE